MRDKRHLVVLDFDGFLINSYEVIRATFEAFGLDIGDEARFKNRRKFLKYLGGGKELLGNLVSYSLPKKRKFRAVLTDEYERAGKIYSALVPFLNRVIADPRLDVGVVSRNFALSPGTMIRSVLRNSGVDESELDFVVPIPVGAKKDDILAAMRSSRHETCLLGADEISDFRAAEEAGFESVMASYGFDRHERLTKKGGVPEHLIVSSPDEAVEHLTRHCYPDA